MDEDQTIEQKLLPDALKAESIDLEKRTVRGYASVFNVMDSHGDIVMPGAFLKTIKERAEKIRHLVQHDAKEPVAVPTLHEDAKGLFFESVIAKNERGDKLLADIQCGLITGMSIGFWVKAWEEFEDDELRAQLVGWAKYSTMRRITEFKLLEISSVTFGSNEEAGVIEVRDAFGRTTKPMRKTPAIVVPPPETDLEPLVKSLRENASEMREYLNGCELRNIIDALR